MKKWGTLILIGLAVWSVPFINELERRKQRSADAYASAPEYQPPISVAQASTPTQETARKCLSGVDGSHRESIKKIKSLLKDPDSFEHIETLFIENRAGGLAIITKYRAKNSLGGYAVEEYVTHISPDDCKIVGDQETGVPSIGTAPSSLTKAARYGHTDAVRKFLQEGGNPNSKDDWGDFPLSRAAYGGHAEIVRILLNAGANPNLQDDDGETPLGNARRQGHSQIVRMLQEAGAK